VSENVKGRTQIELETRSVSSNAKKNTSVGLSRRTVTAEFSTVVTGRRKYVKPESLFPLAGYSVQFC